jgi:TonB-linked SusC/RagA family outer membrane protein
LAGADYRNKKRQIWFGKSIFRGNLANGEAGISRLNRIRYNVDNTLLFKKKINRHNRINGTVGFVLDGINLEQSSFSASDFANEDLRYNGISFGQVFEPMQYFRSQESILSFLGRVNYSLKNRYLFTVSFRSDGASKFAKGNKYSYFPSAAFAWRIINEPFLKNNNLFSEAKFRIGVGRTGSQAIRPYQTFNRFGATANLLAIGGGGAETAIALLNLGNPDLIWETTDQFNAGLDFGFDNDRFVGNIDVYYKQTRDLLQQLNIGPSAGFETIITNQGDLVNRGVEFGLTAHILEGPFQWTVFGNVSLNRNEVRNLGLPPTQFGVETFSAFLGTKVSGGTVFKVPANIYIEGQPAGIFWGYKTDGIIDTPEELAEAPAVQGVTPLMGDVLYLDQNNDGIINDFDLTIIGDPNPDFTYGFGTEFSYKGFSLDLFFNGVYGNDIANGNLGREDYALGNSDNVRQEAYFGAWREGKTDATHPRLGYPIQGDFTDRMVEDGSFLRLTYVSLGYSLPSAKIKGVDSATLFVSGNNLLLFTDYSGFDPEVNSFSFDPTRQGIDWNSFPNQKSVAIGLNLTF